MSVTILSIVAVIAFGSLMNCEAATGQKSCRDVLTDFNRMQFKEISLCSKDLQYNSAKEKSQKSACIMKCVLQHMGLINAAGALSMDQYNSYLKSQFPPSLQQRANITFSPCLQILRRVTSGTNLSLNTIPVPEDILCKAYEPFIKCISISSLKLCSGLV